MLALPACSSETQVDNTVSNETLLSNEAFADESNRTAVDDFSGDNAFVGNDTAFANGFDEDLNATATNSASGNRF